MRFARLLLCAFVMLGVSGIDFGALVQRGEVDTQSAYARRHKRHKKHKKHARKHKRRAKRAANNPEF
jgi:hypothetical protein